MSKQRLCWRQKSSCFVEEMIKDVEVEEVEVDDDDSK